MSGGMGSGTMDDMVKMLASASEAQRRDMIKTRLSSFAQMNDEERANGMKKDDDRRWFRSWTRRAFGS